MGKQNIILIRNNAAVTAMEKPAAVVKPVVKGIAAVLTRIAAKVPAVQAASAARMVNVCRVAT